MNTINLKSFSTKEITRKVSKSLSVPIESICNSNTILIPSKYGKGSLVSIDFENGLNLLIFDVHLDETIRFNFLAEKAYPLNFIHCQKGVVIHQLCNGDISYQLHPMQNSISACPYSTTQNITIPGGKNVIATVLSVHRDLYSDLDNCLEGEFPSVFVNTIADIQGKNTFFFQGNSDFQLSTALKKLADTEMSNVEDFIFASSDVSNALGHFIRNYKEEQNPSQYRVLLNKYDLECLNLARDIIVGNLDNAPTIPILAKMVGINQQKLKKGFKNIFGVTINKFLIKKRMESAKVLLSQDNNSIRYVARQVGYTNQSHFSSKFREHFGMLPKDFVKSISINSLQYANTNRRN